MPGLLEDRSDILARDGTNNNLRKEKIEERYLARKSFERCWRSPMLPQNTPAQAFVAIASICAGQQANWPSSP
eukprot:9845256-Alexandrium_andersonii.AAC.1